uniref:Uncharacterized protein n=1 Tax=Anguilla anguilla TaxID=7936 RepID=A0A0E9VQX0_ANGAN
MKSFILGYLRHVVQMLLSSVYSVKTIRCGRVKETPLW